MDPSPASTACRFRYRGYQQSRGIREFAFEDVAEEKNKHPVVVNIEVQSLLKHHVHFQDVPRLCIQLLLGNTLTGEAPKGTAIRIIVSDDDLIELLAKAEEQGGTKKRKY